MPARKSTDRTDRTGVSSSKSAAPPPHVPGEKDVKPTDATVPLERDRPTKEARTPLPPEALDRRRQVLDDEPKGGGEKRNVEG